MTTVIRTVPAILAALFAATATLTANAGTWTGGQTGVDNTESSPYNIMNTANWDGAIGSGKQLYLTVSEKTYINSDTDTQIGNDFSPNSGDFVFMGPLKFLSFKGGAENKSVTILKKGDWTVDTWHFFAASADNSKFTMTNETGNVKLINGSYLVVGNGANSEAEIVNISGDWTIPSFVNIGKGTGSVGSFIYNSGTLTANGVIDVGGASGAKGTLVVNGGTVNAKSNLAAGAGGNGTIIVNGGNVSVGGYLYVPYSGSGTLTINGGTVSVASDKNVQFGKGINAINLNGGTLVTKQITRNGGNSANMQYVNLNGGTLKANNTGTLINAPDGYMWVTVSPGGGTIDCNGNAVTINLLTSQQWGGVQGSGTLTFTGGNTITLKCNYTGKGTYSGVTRVTPGTTLVTDNFTVKTQILKNGLVVAGIPTAGQTIFTYSEDLTGTDISKVTCLLAPNAVFAIGGEDNKSIIVESAGTPLDINYWTGAIDNDLSNDANWSKGTKPSSTENANIYCVTNSTLTNGAGFAPSAITFLEGSAAVTINGDDFNNIVAVTNLSSASHTINAKVYFAGDIQVKQAAMAETGDLSKAHVTFAGGAYAAAGCSLESGNYAAVYSRCIFGKYYLAPTSVSPWTAQYQGSSKRVCVADGSYLDVPYAGNVSELYVGTGAKVVIGDMNTTSRPSWQVKGEIAVTNELNVTIGGDTYLDYDNGSGTYKFEKVVLGSSETSTWVFFYFGDQAGSGTTKNVWIGAGGINIAGNAHSKTLYAFGKQNNDVLYLRPWHSDYTIGTRSGNSYSSIKISKETHFGTTDENGVARTVTVNGRLEYTGAIYIEGTGRFVSNNAYSNYGGAVTVKDTATLVLNKKLTSGAMTVKNGATLEIASSATTGTSAVTLEAGSTLKLNATSLTNTLNLPTEGTATIRIDGTKLRAGDHVIATVGTGTNVALDPSSTVLDGRKGAFSVDGSGNLVLTINPTGFMILVR